MYDCGAFGNTSNAVALRQPRRESLTEGNMRQSRIAAIICDYGNVLVRTLHAAPRATWERRLGLAAGDLQRVVHNDHSWVAAQLGQITVEAYWQDVGATLGLTSPDTAMLRTTFYAGDVLNIELIASLDQQRAAGIRTALLSNFSTELRHFLAAHDLLQRLSTLPSQPRRG
jgi:FMN phosphatase YigB (HAD superfamily)